MFLILGDENKTIHAITGMVFIEESHKIHLQVENAEMQKRVQSAHNAHDAPESKFYNLSNMVNIFKPSLNNLMSPTIRFASDFVSFR